MQTIWYSISNLTNTTSGMLAWCEQLFVKGSTDRINTFPCSVNAVLHLWVSKDLHSWSFPSVHLQKKCSTKFPYFNNVRYFCLFCMYDILFCYWSNLLYVVFRAVLFYCKLFFSQLANTTRLLERHKKYADVKGMRLPILYGSNNLLMAWLKHHLQYIQGHGTKRTTKTSACLCHSFGLPSLYAL